jgi:hypothetical protein
MRWRSVHLSAAAAARSECDLEFVTVTGRPTYENNIRLLLLRLFLAAAPDSPPTHVRWRSEKRKKKEGEDF